MGTPHNPLRKEDYARSAGDSLMEMMLKRFFLFFLVFSAFTYFLGYVVGTLKTDTTVRSPIAFDVALTAVLGAALWVTHKRYEKKFDNLALGRAGERFVARCLEELRPYGYTPVHDLVCTSKKGKCFNIDHVLVGPTGVFVVETKTRSKSGNDTINDKKDIEKDIEQVHGNTESLKDLLRERMGRIWNVTPMLTYPRWFVQDLLTEQVIREDGVYVFSTAAIGKMLHRYFPSHVLTDKDIQEIIHSLTTYAHDKSEEKVPLIYHCTTHTMPSTPQLKDRVLTAIRERTLHPTPRWHFLAREWFIRCCALTALVAGSLSATLVFYIINTSWPLRAELVHSPLWSVVSIIPVVWFVLLAVAIGYAVHAVHRSRRGYRFNSSWLVVGALALSLFAGAFLYAAGVGRAIDDYLIERAPGYPELSGHHPSRFFAPALGIRTGVIEMRGDALFLVGPDGETRLDTSALSDSLPRTALERSVRVAGTTTPEGMFKVEGIRPLRGRGGRMPRAFSDGERMVPVRAY